MEVSDLVNGDFEDGNSGVGWRTVLLSSQILEPSLDCRIVKLLDKRSVLDAPASKLKYDWTMSKADFALPAMEYHPVLLSEPSAARLT